MKNLKEFSIFFLFILVFSSCAREYIPTTINAPLLTNKGEVQVGLLVGTSGYDQHFAIALSDNIGIFTTTSFSSQTNDTSSDDYHRHFLVDGGIGYYTAFSNIGRFEIFGGYGFGKISTKIDEQSYISIADLTYHKIFIQPGFGASTKFFDISMSPRIAFLLIENKDPRLIIEPVFVSKFGYKYIFFSTQLGFSVKLFATQDTIIYFPVMMSFGIQFKFGKIYDSESSF